VRRVPLGPLFGIGYELLTNVCNRPRLYENLPTDVAVQKTS